MNSLFSMLGNMLGSSNGGTSSRALLMQAFGAFMRGESPQAFMKRMATQVPELKKMNLNDLQNTAQQLCQQRGTTMDEVAKLAESMLPADFKK